MESRCRARRPRASAAGPRHLRGGPPGAARDPRAGPGHLDDSPARPSGAVAGTAVVARDVTHARRIAGSSRIGDARRPYRPGEPLRVRAAARRALVSASGGPRGARRLLPRPRRLQAGQRHLRPPGGGRAAAAAERPHAGTDALPRHPGRLGGDEFGLLLEHCAVAQGRPDRRRDPEAIGAHRFTLGINACRRASIGIGPIRAGGAGGGLIRAADARAIAPSAPGETGSSCRPAAAGRGRGEPRVAPGLLRAHRAGPSSACSRSPPAATGRTAARRGSSCCSGWPRGRRPLPARAFLPCRRPPRAHAELDRGSSARRSRAVRLAARRTPARSPRRGDQPRGRDRRRGSGRDGARGAGRRRGAARGTLLRDRRIDVAPTRSRAPAFCASCSRRLPSDCRALRHRNGRVHPAPGSGSTTSRSRATSCEASPATRSTARWNPPSTRSDTPWVFGPSAPRRKTPGDRLSARARRGLRPGVRRRAARAIRRRHRTADPARVRTSSRPLHGRLWPAGQIGGMGNPALR